MAENFWILITPPEKHFQAVQGSICDSFLELGWTFEEATYGTAEQLAHLQAPTKNELLRARSGQATLLRDRRLLALDFDFQFKGSIALGGDLTFFWEIDPLKEMKGIFGGMRLPDGTQVRGDVEGVIDRDWSPWFRWITQLDATRWQELSDKLPEALNRELIRIGKSHVVLMSDSPYGRVDELTRLARLFGESRPWPDRIPKKLRRSRPRN